MHVKISKKFPICLNDSSTWAWSLHVCVKRLSSMIQLVYKFCVVILAITLRYECRGVKTSDCVHWAKIQNLLEVTWKSLSLFPLPHSNQPMWYTTSLPWSLSSLLLSIWLLNDTFTCILFWNVIHNEQKVGKFRSNAELCVLKVAHPESAWIMNVFSTLLFPLKQIG